MNFSHLGLPQISTRVIGLESKMIDSRTYEVALCRGGPIERTFGTERLRILASSINLDRMRNGGLISVIDSLREDSALTRSLAKLVDVQIQDGTVFGTIKFHQTENGRKAAALVTTGKVDVVVAYSAEGMEIYDSENRRVDPNDAGRADEAGIVFEITRWQIAALGLVRADLAADSDHQDRSYTPISPAIAEIFGRMAERHLAANVDDGVRVAGRRVRPEINRTIFDKGDRADKIIAATRARMRAAQKLMECGGNVDWKAIRLPPDLIYYGTAEKFKP